MGSPWRIRGGRVRPRQSWKLPNNAWRAPNAAHATGVPAGRRWLLGTERWLTGARTFTTNKLALWRPGMTCWWWRTSRSRTCSAGRNPNLTRTPRDSSGGMGRGRSPGSTEALVTLAGASSSRYCAPKRKTLDAVGSRLTPGTPPTGVSAAVTQRPRTASSKRNSTVNVAVTARQPMNTPHPQRKRSWRRQPSEKSHPVVYRAFSNLRHRLGRCNDAPWYRYTFSDSDFAVDAPQPGLSNFDPRHGV